MNRNLLNKYLPIIKTAGLFGIGSNDDKPITQQEKEKLVTILDNMRMASIEYAEAHSNAWDSAPWTRKEQIHAAKSYIPAVAAGAIGLGLGILGAKYGTSIGRMAAAPIAKKALLKLPNSFVSRQYLGRAAAYAAGSGTLALGGLAGAGLASLGTDAIAKKLTTSGMDFSKKLYRTNKNNRIRDNAINKLDASIHNEDVQVINKIMADKNSPLAKELTRCVRDNITGKQTIGIIFIQLGLNKLPIKA